MRGVSLSNEIEIACSVPLGLNETTGSEARWYPAASPDPPAQRLNFGDPCDQVWPPSSLAPMSRPWLPPSDQRSCCQKPTTFWESVGLTATHGSTSAFW